MTYFAKHYTGYEISELNYCVKIETHIPIKLYSYYLHSAKSHDKNFNGIFLLVCKSLFQINTTHWLKYFQNALCIVIITEALIYRK